VAARVAVHSDEDFPPLPPPPVEPLPEADPPRVARALARLRPLEPPTSGRVVLSLEALEDVAGCPRRFRLRWVEGHRERPGRGGIALSSPRHRDAAPSLARKLLASLPPASWAEGLPDARIAPSLARLGLSPAEGQALGILPALRRLSPALAGFVSGWTWTPDAPLRLDLGGVEVRDLLPLLLESPRAVRAVTVLAGPPGTEGAPAAEAATLAALGAEEGRPVQVAAVPLEGGRPEVGWSDAPRLGHEALRAAAAAAVHAQHALPPVLARERCLALGCGFVARCHGRTRGL